MKCADCNKPIEPKDVYLVAENKLCGDCSQILTVPYWERCEDCGVFAEALYTAGPGEHVCTQCLAKATPDSEHPELPFTEGWLEGTIDHLEWLLQNDMSVAGFHTDTLLANLRATRHEIRSLIPKEAPNE